MKKTTILYWIFTGLFAALMLSTTIPELMNTPENKSFMEHLGYPPYFTYFIGGAKLLGIIGILLPIPPRLKEWAYAGLFFDLVGATYSALASDGFAPPMLFMLVFFLLWALSYVYYRKKLSSSVKTH